MRAAVMPLQARLAATHRAWGENSRSRVSFQFCSSATAVAVGGWVDIIPSFVGTEVPDRAYMRPRTRLPPPCRPLNAALGVRCAGSLRWLVQIEYTTPIGGLGGGGTDQATRPPLDELPAAALEALASSAQRVRTGAVSRAMGGELVPARGCPESYSIGPVARKFFRVEWPLVLSLGC
jgi:hypothetical protein